MALMTRVVRSVFGLADQNNPISVVIQFQTIVLNLGTPIGNFLGRALVGR